MVQLRCGNHYVGRDPAATINLAAAVSQFNLCGLLRAFAVVVILIKGDGFIVALDQPAAGRVILRRGQRQASVFA